MEYPKLEIPESDDEWGVVQSGPGFTTWEPEDEQPGSDGFSIGSNDNEMPDILSQTLTGSDEGETEAANPTGLREPSVPSNQTENWNQVKCDGRRSSGLGRYLPEGMANHEDQKRGSRVPRQPRSHATKSATQGDEHISRATMA